MIRPVRRSPRGSLAIQVTHFRRTYWQVVHVEPDDRCQCPLVVGLHLLADEFALWTPMVEEQDEARMLEDEIE